MEKRNKYLEIAGDRNIDFLLVIDSDEYAVIDAKELTRNLARIKEIKSSSAANGKIEDTPEVHL
jgi:hypothetical protein